MLILLIAFEFKKYFLRTIAFIGVLTTVSIEMAQVIVNNAVEMSADVIELNSNILSDQINELNGVDLQERARFRNIIFQIQDFDQ